MADSNQRACPLSNVRLYSDYLYFLGYLRTFLLGAVGIECTYAAHFIFGPSSRTLCDELIAASQTLRVASLERTSFDTENLCSLWF